jgi:hypothetical protein
MRCQRYRMKHLMVMYVLDLLIVLLAMGAALASNHERRRTPFPRLQLLLPGIFAFASALILLAYPDIRDLADPQVWLVGLASFLVGSLRGATMRIESDRVHGLVRVAHGRDASWIAWIMVLFATAQGAIETGLGEANPYEPTAEFLMLLAGGFLLGRSAVVWLRARDASHHDLQEI